MHQPIAARDATGARALVVAALVVIACLLGTATVPSLAGASSSLDPSFGTTKDIWIGREHLRSLPTTGSAWEDLAADARGSWGTPAIVDQESDHDVKTLAGALYAVRTNDVAMRTRVVEAIEAAIGTEDGGRTLALARNLTGYVIAADLVGHRSARFEQWVSDVRHEQLDGRTLVSTHEDRPNNWGTHAGAARMVAAAYLGDATDLARAARVFRGFLGDRSAYAGFEYGDLSWQSDEARPVGINPPGATKDGVRVDGVLPDDQRRCLCPVQDPPPRENYVWEAMQGAVTQATILARHGHADVWTWSTSALGRAARFLTVDASFPAEGDDTFLTYLLDRGLGTSYSTGVEARPGKSIGYTQWTHSAEAARLAGPATAPTTTAAPTTTTTAPAPTTTAPTTTTTAPPPTTTTTTAPTTTTTAPAAGNTVQEPSGTDAYTVVHAWARWEIRLLADGRHALYRDGRLDSYLTPRQVERYMKRG